MKIYEKLQMKIIVILMIRMIMLSIFFFSIVQAQQGEAFTSLVDTAEIQTEAGNYKEALEAYRKAYRICPMRDLEEQMAWLMGEVGDEKWSDTNGDKEDVYQKSDKTES